MRKTLLALMLIAALIPLAVTQDGWISPPLTAKENAQVVSAQPDTEQAIRKGAYYPPFCPPRTCLYYAGDFDSNYSGADGLNNVYDDNGLIGQVWVGVKPAQDATVTGATFVESLSYGEVGVNPTPFLVQVGIKPGQAGRTICSTSGNATVSVYENNQGFNLYSYTIKKLSTPCKLRKGKVYFVNLLPIYSDGSNGFVMDVPPKSPQNHHGWKSVLDDSYFSSTYFDRNYVPAQSECGQFYCGAFSIALTGKE
jgi:hypothetical protein